MSGVIRNIFAVAVVFLTGCSRSSNTQLKTRSAEAERKGIEFLAANQKENGAFATQRWLTISPQKQVSFDTPFTAAQVLYSLSFCNDPTARKVQENAAAYLVSQEEPPGVWKYLGKGGYYSTDVDDTSLVWSALKRFGRDISPAGLEAVRTSRNEAGLFNTWIGDRSSWYGLRDADKEIDSVVNLNALLLFGLASENVDVVCDYAIAQVENGGFQRGAVYYDSPLAFTFAFSRAYSDGSMRCLGKAVAKIRAATLSLQKTDGGWGNDYETAVGLLTLINLGEKGEAVERGLNNLMARQSPDGGWALDAAYRGASNPVRFGSRALTTALSVEIFAKYRAR